MILGNVCLVKKIFEKISNVRMVKSVNFCKLFFNDEEYKNQVFYRLNIYFIFIRKIENYSLRFSTFYY